MYETYLKRRQATGVRQQVSGNRCISEAFWPAPCTLQHATCTSIW